MITLVIPTLDMNKAKRVANMANATCLAHVPVEVVISYQEKPLGFTKAVNDGIKKADDSSDICLLNDDIYWFQLGWLEILRRALYQQKNFGISAPSGHSGTEPMKSASLGMTGIQVVSQAPFWCVLMKRRMLNGLGLLDEAFIHYASDNWYCYQMRKKGWRCVWAKAVYLGHRKHGSGSRGEWRKHDHQLYWKRRHR